MSTELAERVETPDIQLGALQASTPSALVQGATVAANELAKLIDSRQLYSNIQGRKYVQVEGWLTLATMMGCLPQEESNDAREDGSYVAVVSLRRMSDGAVLSRASAECGGPDERVWQKRPPYARRSMAATRATSKACRLAFAWVIALAGYATTPAEEMDGVCGADNQPSRRSNVISDAQRKRLRAIQNKHGVPDDVLKKFVQAHGYESSRDIERGKPYEDIVAQVEEWGSAAENDDAQRQGETIEHDDTVPF